MDRLRLISPFLTNPNPYQASFEILFPRLLKPGGVYIIEDVHWWGAVCMVTARPFVATASHGLRLVYLLTRFVLVFMDEDIAPGLPRRPPGRRGGGYCCRMVGSDPLVAVPAAGFVAAAHNLVLAAAVAPRAAAPSVRKGLACGPTRCVLATV